MDAGTVSPGDELPDDAVPVVSDAAPSSEVPPASEPTSPPPDQPPETLDTAPPGSEPGLATPPVPPTQTFVAPSGVPFTVRVDRNELTIDGAVRTPDKGVYFAPEAFNRFQNSYVGDRQQWNLERRQLEARVTAAETAAEQRQSVKDLERDQALEAFAKIFADPTGQLFQQEYANWQTNGPRLQAEVRARAVEVERDQLAARIQAQEQKEQEAVLEPQMQHWLGSEVEKVLADAQYTGLFERPQAAALLKELWSQHLTDCFFKGRDGRIHMDTERVRGLIEGRAQWVRQARQGMERVQAVKAANAATLAPTKPGVPTPAKAVTPKVTTTKRDEQGRWTKPDAEQWERDFAKKRYTTT